jgi:ribokinase
MQQEGVILDHLVEQADARPVHSYILVDQARGTRNIFADTRGAIGAHPEWPLPEIIRRSRVLFVDHFGLPGMLRAARAAREAAIPIVADLERDSGPGFSELLKLIDHLVISSHFAHSLTGCSDPADAVNRLWNEDRDVVVVTSGENGCWFRSRATGSAVTHQPAFVVKTTDTTGCGDVFHGVYAAALAERLPIERRVLLASAAAAMKAAKPGGQSGIPRRAALEEFVSKG